jgi:alkanesulfonate monooxygenase
MQMLMPSLDVAAGVSGAHFGIITRPTDDEARSAAAEIFPESKEDEGILELSMLNTDSQWKRDLQALSVAAGGGHSAYSLSAFRNFKADCPYLVAGYRSVAAIVARLTQRGIHTFILDIPARQQEFAHVRMAFNLVGAEYAR